ncbi:FixH family protein [Lichenicoccus sp.]|uniref:FixH family protein n=1 Tax=Lichenicoccus sp. TaxID=2781899 RepID=UPI003D10BB79
MKPWIGRLACVTLAAAVSLPAAVRAATPGYRLEVVGTPIFSAGNETVHVRILENAGNKPVADAFVRKVTATMKPGGMPKMTAPILSLSDGAPGAFKLSFEPPMSGLWLVGVIATTNKGRDTIRCTMTVDVKS